VVGAAGCDISAKSFAGAIIQMTINGAAPTAPNQHLELWARTQYDDIVRIDHIYEDPEGMNPPDEDPRRRFGFAIRNAITMDDPCMIDKKTGALLTSPDAYTPATIAGVFQSAEDQAAAVRARIAQLTSTSNCDPNLPQPNCGQQPANLYTVIPWSPKVDRTPLAGITASTPRADRLAACRAYWASHPLAYTPDPTQIVSPIHGTTVGFLDWTTNVPVAGYNSVRIESSVNLKGIRELFMTVETVDQNQSGDGVDPLNRGPVYLEGKPTLGGRGVVFFNLNGPTASGTAAIHTDLDEDTSGF
jgi:hypothetical protein